MYRNYYLYLISPHELVINIMSHIDICLCTRGSGAATVSPERWRVRSGGDGVGCAVMVVGHRCPPNSHDPLLPDLGLGGHVSLGLLEEHQLDLGLVLGGPFHGHVAKSMARSKADLGESVVVNALTSTFHLHDVLRLDDGVDMFLGQDVAGTLLLPGKQVVLQTTCTVAIVVEAVLVGIRKAGCGAEGTDDGLGLRSHFLLLLVAVVQRCQFGLAVFVECWDGSDCHSLGKVDGSLGVCVAGTAGRWRLLEAALVWRKGRPVVGCRH